ncbi:heme exporter protein D [Ectothiorhodosinus mongolicus]|uniref:Heme exporter protein D n=1 Tax=Ectothiorhodosinus mongolicus TaxID=233100 RepID=A0A1R3VYN2_9GAMM|nr:heme exporter protein CcmD [Ectothiorhodosinus mongolicus]ULX57190.1 heme exporter protein CcmD [Ectothiorhodosinus mongolicus]SIT70339.1 heme exporter protein D [Ectothiorhodosinus mongolicus]
MMEYLAMGGHGFYIWGSYGVALLLLIIELFLLRRRRVTQAATLRRLARLSEQQENV